MSDQQIKLAAVGGAGADGKPVADRQSAADRAREYALSVWQKDACAPLVVAGPQLHAVRAMLLKRAQEMGHVMTKEPNLRVSVDGVEIAPEKIEGRYRFQIPEGATDIRLVSRSGVPAHMTADGTDYRTLGVAIARIVVDGQEVPLTDKRRLRSGWYEPEPHWCWTDGNASLAIAGARMLEVNIAMTAQYWEKHPEPVEEEAEHEGPPPEPEIIEY
jgi:hypothetical protein